MTIRVGLVGAGLMMQAVHLPHLTQMNGVEVVALAEWNGPLAERVARAFGIPRAYDSAEAMVEKEEKLDAVLVVTRKDLHAQAALPALERGISVFIEKPLEVSIAAARQMVETARKSGAVLMVGYMKRYDPSVLALQQIIADRQIGDVLQANIHDFGGDWTQGALGVGHLDAGFSGDGDPYEFRFERQTAGGGTAQAVRQETWKEIYDEWIEVWVHDVNLARAFFGEAEDLLYVQHEKPRLALIRFERARVLFEVGSCNYDQAPWDEQLIFYGSGGRAELRFPAPLLFRQPTKLVIEQPHRVISPRVPNGEPFQRELVHFFRCVAQGRKPLTDGEDAVRDLQLCEAIAKR